MSDNQFIKAIIAVTEYCIDGAFVDEQEIVLYASEFNEAQKQIPKSFNGKQIKIVKEVL